MGKQPEREEIDKQLNKAYDQVDRGGSKWPGMSYEQGVIAAIDWVRGYSSDLPMEDD